MCERQGGKRTDQNAISKFFINQKQRHEIKRPAPLLFKRFSLLTIEMQNLKKTLKKKCMISPFLSQTKKPQAKKKCQKHGSHTIEREEEKKNRAEEIKESSLGDQFRLDS